ncbi:MAG: hypothetical protein WCC12_05265, partial [Anaerolineales bacterium]
MSTPARRMNQALGFPLRETIAASTRVCNITLDALAISRSTSAEAQTICRDYARSAAIQRPGHPENDNAVRCPIPGIAFQSAVDRHITVIWNPVDGHHLIRANPGIIIGIASVEVDFGSQEVDRIAYNPADAQKLIFTGIDSVGRCSTQVDQQNFVTCHQTTARRTVQ